MLSKELQKLIENDLNINKVNEFLQSGTIENYKDIMNDYSVTILNNSLFILFYYSLLLKGLARDNKTSEILLYLNKGYKNLDTNYFISKVFLDILTEINIENIGIANNKYLSYLLQKNDNKIYFKDGSSKGQKGTEGSELNISMYLYIELFDTNLDFLTLEKEEIDKLIEYDKNLIDIISEINTIKYLLNKANEYSILNNLLMLNSNYIQSKIDKINFDSSSDPSTELVVKINTGLADVLEINPYIYGLLNQKGLNVSDSNYKTLIAKNFLENYILKILPKDIEKAPFFKDYVKGIENNIKRILFSYYDNIDEDINITVLSDHQTKVVIKGFDPDEKKRYAQLNDDFGLLQYLYVEQYIYDYIIQNKLLEGDINNITMEIILEQHVVGILNDRVKSLVTYKLFINGDQIFEETN